MANKPFTFQKKVDKRVREAMVGFLADHPRHDGLYSQNVKIHSIGLDEVLTDRAFDVLERDGDSVVNIITQVTENLRDELIPGHSIYSAGRSAGHLVLAEYYRSDSGYKSRCTHCGKLNFKRVPPEYRDHAMRVIADELLRSSMAWKDAVYLGQSAIQALPVADNHKLGLVGKLRRELAECSASDRCGVCRGKRVNLARPVYREHARSRPVDDRDEFEDPEVWDMESLRDRVRLVQGFDRLCDAIRLDFINEIMDERWREAAEEAA